MQLLFYGGMRSDMQKQTSTAAKEKKKNDAATFVASSELAYSTKH